MLRQAIRNLPGVPFLIKLNTDIEDCGLIFVTALRPLPTVSTRHARVGKPIQTTTPTWPRGQSVCGELSVLCR